MRKPFELKNGLGGKSPELEAFEPSIDFEESVLEGNAHFLERLGERRIYLKFFWLLLIAVFGIFFARLYYFTFNLHSIFLEMAEGNRLRVEYIPAPRGGIYDSRGQLIAGNRPSFELVASPLDLPKDPQESEKVFGQVSQISGMPIGDIKTLLDQKPGDPKESILVEQNLTKEEALIFLESASSLPGFRIINTPIRDYKDSEVFAHLLGYVGKINVDEYTAKSQDGYLFNDSIGKTGLESAYEEFLRGSFGQRQVEVDARGVVKRTFGEKASAGGDNLYLNIDAELQNKLYESLTKRLSSIGRKAAAAIAMDPRNGRILAYISLPSFDNNLFAEGITVEDYSRLSRDNSRPLFNRGVAGTYPPGSTIKPVVASSALQEGVVSENTIIEDKGHIVIPNIYGGPDYFFYGYNRAGLGRMNLRSAIALSSDIYFYVAGGGYELAKIEGLGIDRLAKYFRQFKLGEKLGIDLPGEQVGLVPTPEWKKEYFAGDEVLSRWYLGDTYHVSIGQGDLLVTPLQVLSWTAALANGGKIYKPFVVDRVEGHKGELKKNNPEVLRQLEIDPKYIQIVREGMRQVVTAGTAKSLQQLPISSAGKTGTAQFDAKNLSRTHAWFTAFAPYENPEIAILVLIEDGGEGGTNSVPVAREVLDWWAKNRYLTDR